MIDLRPAWLEAKGRVRRSTDGAVTSWRYLTKAEGLGLIVTQADAHADLDERLCFSNHQETNVLLEGAVRLTDEAGGAVSDLTAGSLWTCGPQTPHRLEVRNGSRVLNIHDPALKQAAPNLTIDRQDGLGFVVTRHLVGSGDNVKFEAGDCWLALLVCSGQAASDRLETAALPRTMVFLIDEASLSLGAKEDLTLVSLRPDAAI